MKLDAIKGKAYITSAGEKAVNIGSLDDLGNHQFIVGEFISRYNPDGTHWMRMHADIIDEWPETTDAPDGHVNTAEIVYSKPVTQDGWNDWILLGDSFFEDIRMEDCQIADDIDGNVVAYRTRKAPVMTTVTLYGHLNSADDWNFWSRMEDGDDVKITMVLIDGVIGDTAKVEGIE